MVFYDETIKILRQARPDLTIQKKTIKLLESKLRKKMIHARLNGFIQHHYTTLMEKQGQRSEGGQSLRDNLYSFTTKNKSSE